MHLTHSELERAAFAFATAAHAGQARKYTAEPYICHPAPVVGILKDAGVTDEAILAAAWLHDTVEDNAAIENSHIRLVFGDRVAQLVDEVTDPSRPEDGNRATRKAIDREHLAKASAAGQTIKLADLISNTGSITLHDPDFAVVYMREKRDLLPLLADGNTALFAKAKALVDDYFNKKAA